jgi:hypothetical protein
MGISETQSFFWPVFFACIGGAIVVIGLLLETLAEKKWFKNVKSFRRWHSAKCFGEWMVIGGILIEVADAGWTAHEIKKAESNVANLDAKTPRFLKPFDRIVLERELSEYPDKPRITLFLAADAFDAQEIGQQLFNCFSDAHFPMNPDMPVGFVSDGGGHGIIVGGYGITNKTADAIVFALKQFGLDAKTNGGVSSYSNEIFIRIEKK